MAEAKVLVVGATGHLGSVITRKLLSARTPVRALARNAEKLAALGRDGAEVTAVDLRNVAKTTEACRGITQIIATANNNMGKGETSPTRIDLSAYQNLCAAARNAGVKRLIYVSFRGVDHHFAKPLSFHRLDADVVVADRLRVHQAADDQAGAS